MKAGINRHRYPVDGNKSIEYEQAVLFPVNAVLAKTLAKDEWGTVVFLSTIGGAENHSNENMTRFREELDEINREIGAHLRYETIEVPFRPQIDVFERLISGLISKTGQKTEIIADITYGIKPLPMILLCALTFTEKFYAATVQNIIYGKVDFADGKTTNPMIYDITPIYYLNKLIGSMECKTADAATGLLNDFFAM
jgi:hypothetical protein